MKIHSVHSRVLCARADRVGALLDGLGSRGDRLWPRERWPTTPFVLEGPLAVGAAARQGLIRETQIRHIVEEYEPGRRVVFRFAPGLGLVGTHRFEVEPLGTDGARLTHTLECRVEARMIPFSPILIRQHDALVEDILDCAELATAGPPARPARWSAAVRLSNALELRLARRRGLLPPARPARDDRHRSGLARRPGMAGGLAPGVGASLLAAAIVAGVLLAQRARVAPTVLHDRS